MYWITQGKAELEVRIFEYIINFQITIYDLIDIANSRLLLVLI